MEMSATTTTVLPVIVQLTWLNDHNLSHCYTLFRSDRASANKTRGRGVLIFLSSRVGFCKRMYDTESCKERVEIR
jgi:hypothetical protein